jgi:hypothetical protein
MVGSRGSGTIGPPGDDTARTARRERAQLRLVTLPPAPVRKSLPPESAPFDPELEQADVELTRRRSRRRVVPRQTPAWRRRYRARLSRPRLRCPGWIARIHARGRVLVAAIVALAACATAVGVLGGTSRTFAEPPSRSSSVRSSSSAFVGAVDGQQALIIDPFQHLLGVGLGAEGLGAQRSHLPSANGQTVRHRHDRTTAASVTKVDAGPGTTSAATAPHRSVAASVHRTTNSQGAPNHVASTDEANDGTTPSTPTRSDSTPSSENRSTGTPACTIYPGSGGCLP